MDEMRGTEEEEEPGRCCLLHEEGREGGGTGSSSGRGRSDGPADGRLLQPLGTAFQRSPGRVSDPSRLLVKEDSSEAKVGDLLCLAAAAGTAAAAPLSTDAVLVGFFNTTPGGGGRLKPTRLLSADGDEEAEPGQVVGHCELEDQRGASSESLGFAGAATVGLLLDDIMLAA